ncbi:MAG: hypothetical protein GY719_02460 [bacterium]|nr:hypothetical protein [bacterium]
MNQMDHAHDHAAEPMMMVMAGVPLGLYLVAVGAVILLSFFATEWLGPRSTSSRRSRWRVDLTRGRRVYRWFRSRWFQAVPQMLAVSLFLFLIYVGLFGSRVQNLTPTAVWTLWWAGLIFAVLVLGSAWCFICPWDGLANLVSRLRVAARVDTLSMGLRFPHWLENTYPALLLFALLTWLELGFGVTTDPRATAYLGLAMAAMAIVAALLWDGKRFCAHFCPVGRICGIYSSFSPIEIRSRKQRSCDACTTEDCLNGNELGYPCPTGLSLKNLDMSVMCTMCTECFKSCRKHNVAVNLRPFGADLLESRSSPSEAVSRRGPATDHAWLAVMLLALTLFHGLSMTSLWESFEPGRWSLLKWMGQVLGTPQSVNFTLAMGLAVGLPIAVYSLSCNLAARWVANGVSGRQLFTAFAYSLLPVALFYHLAHNLMHLLAEGGHVVPLLGDPMGRGANWLGLREVHVGALASDQTLWVAQVVLVVVGHVFGVVAAHRIAHRLVPDRRAATRSLVPLTALMVLLSITGLSLMHMDMNMRMGRM